MIIKKIFHDHDNEYEYDHDDNDNDNDHLIFQNLHIEESKNIKEYQIIKK